MIVIGGVFNMELLEEGQKITMEKDGKTIEYDVLFTFDSEDTMKSYIGYTDHSFGENGRKNIFVSAVRALNPKIELEDITDEAELQMINDVLVQIDKESQNS